MPRRVAGLDLCVYYMRYMCRQLGARAGKVIVCTELAAGLAGGCLICVMIGVMIGFCFMTGCMVADSCNNAAGRPGMHSYVLGITLAQTFIKWGYETVCTRHRICSHGTAACDANAAGTSGSSSAAWVRPASLWYRICPPGTPYTRHSTVLTCSVSHCCRGSGKCWPASCRHRTGHATAQTLAVSRTQVRPRCISS